MKKTALILVLFLMACAPQKEIPKELIYAHTVQNTPNAATITGYDEKSNALLTSDTSYIYSVDGKYIKTTMGEWDKWSNVVALQPGARRIAVQFRKGVHSAMTFIQFMAEPNGRYQIRHITPETIYGYDGGHIETWIVDMATDKPVSDIVRTSINSPPQMVPMFIGK